ncbi:MAG TPA: non-homologous end-joining DNA ligase [Myxococcota bacterium]|nr:non-homologous end-joining DNA ligase [Myxococcota bacterium]
MSLRRYGRIPVETSNEDKVFFPGIGATKGDVIDYYDRIADRMLPHLRDRPLVLQRFPDGIDAKGFYQKQAGGHFPDWITTTRVDLVTTGGTQELVVCDKQATLVYLADQGVIAFHVWLSRTDRIRHPDQLVVDLDPAGDDFESARRAALHVRNLMEELGLPCFAKLTGSKGVHVLVPLDRSADFERVREFAQGAMQLLEARFPDELTTARRKSARGDRVFLDVDRNAYAQTAVAPWSLRPLSDAPIAVPVSWTDLEESRVEADDYDLQNVFRRIAPRSDPWKGHRRRAHSLGRPERALRARMDKEID